jgi:hypothetical protein
VEQELYGTPNRVSCLTLSPDGKQLAFAEGRALKLMSASGGEPRELVTGEHHVSTMAWTSDGGHLLFQRVNFGRSGVIDSQTRAELWRVPAASGNAQKLDVDLPMLEHLRIHPDGRQVAFTAHLEPDKIELWSLEDFLPPLADVRLPAAANAAAKIK